MGANGSSYPHSCSPRIGANAQTQQTFIGTSSYSQHGYAWESKLYSLEHGHERPTDRKKKSLGLATLKRRFIKRKKSSRSADHARQMRELLSGWDVRDTNALVEEYEGTAALKELSFQASLARAEAPSLPRDLAALYQHKYCTDVDLIFHGTCFPAHRAILAARCPFFKTLLSSSPGYGAEVHMDIETAGIDVPMFSALLHYLYTGEFGVSSAEDSRLQNVDVLVQLSEEFGTPNSLEADMKGLFDYMCYYDALLSFSSDFEMVESFNAGAPAAGSGGGGGPGTPEEDLRSHKAILSARSPFFRNLLQRRIRTGEEMTERTLQTPTRIVLDESIIPRKYVQVILHCMYTDAVELSLVLRGSPSAGSLGEVQALVSGGRGASTRTEEAMELYHIALFLEFSMLAQGCEDIIVESLSLDSLVPILKWSSQPYGSKWVHRQAMHFLCEEFSQVVTSDVLYELGKEHLLSAIQSDYLQASEQDILKYVVKWGEQQLIKRMADREPNLLSGTAHSVNKRGVKRRDLDVEELKDILSPLLPFIRTEHILPPHSDVLSDALKRGLISTPPSDMLPTAEGGKANAWLRQKNAGIYVRPRLFTPYVEEAKLVLDEMMVEQTDLVRLRLVRMSNVPDTLYMVNNAVPQCCHMVNHQQMTVNSVAAPSVVANEIPVPQLPVVKEMIRRLQELRHTEQVQRAYALNCGEGATVSYELQLRVLREFGLADGAAELLQNPNKFFPDERFGDESPILALRQMGMEPVMREFMPDIALGVSVMSLREQHVSEIDRESPRSPMGPPGHHLTMGPCPSVRHNHGPGHGHSCKRHAPDPKPEVPPEFPDLYDFSRRPSSPGSARTLSTFAGPDLYSHSVAPFTQTYINDSHCQGHAQGRTGPDPLRLDVLGVTSQRHDAAGLSGPQPRAGHAPRGRAEETDLTHGLSRLRSSGGNADGYEDRTAGTRDVSEDSVLAGESQQPHRNSLTEDAARERRSPGKPDYPYKKSAL
ncbi:BTB/POZ domain-containing protein 7 isoform X2 [Corythoichthys intestinalis]|uniref:BTB/POZ domain-containing protein 7 isoform X2 n=1 Tax=Corythoichthys intestinalis TaxID=161448 RepID=UPI0025A4D1F8|nr:BTB/POZ domain-containing protein 7 isoform X2 [Corythoichthys intestinalis]